MFGLLKKLQPHEREVNTSISKVWRCTPSKILKVDFLVSLKSVKCGVELIL